MSKNVILLGLGVYLLMTMRNSIAASTGTARPAGQYLMPSNNQNTELWLRSGALNVAGGLLKEMIRGSATVAATAGDAGAVFDGWSNASIQDFSLGDWA